MEVFLNSFIDMFTTRDFAIITWGIIALVVFSLNKKTRTRTKNFLMSLYSQVNNKFFAILSAYFVVLTIVFYFFGTKFGEWDVYMVKDAALWFLFSGLPINIKYIKEKEYFGQLKDTIFDNFKVALLFDCVFSTYTFSYIIELFTVLLIIYLVYKLTSTENKEEHKTINILAKATLMTLGFLVILYVFYMTWTHHAEVFSKLIITELSLPFFYTCCFILSAVVMKLCLKNKNNYNKHLDTSLSHYADKIEKFDIIHFFIETNKYAVKRLFEKSIKTNRFRTEP